MAGMRLCFVADLNSIHSRKFIGYFPPRGHEVLVISTTPFTGEMFAGARVVSLGTASDALGFFDKSARALDQRVDHLARGLMAWNPSLQLAVIRRSIARRTARAIEDRIGFYERHRGRVRSLVHDFRPDLLQCLRLPIEGYLGGYADYTPTLQFCWGNDLTLYATRYPTYGDLTRRTLSRCAAFLSDCHRDARLAGEWGLPATIPTLVTPGGGGLETERLEKEDQEGERGGERERERDKRAPAVATPRRTADRAATDIRRNDAPLIFLTLRGLGGRYTDNLPVIRAIPRIRETLGDRFRLRFVGPHEPYRPLLLAEARRLGVAEFLEFSGRVPHETIPAAIREADFVFSATYHDGTPNSMLETMWYGGIPLCGDLESVREWITDGENGYLFDMGDPGRIARTFMRAVGERDRHARFREVNRGLIKERADYATCMARVEAFYRMLLSK
ncbi:MAG: glycosyltransferase [Candidatus Eisenbacteria sp.]|nr:glycosyltransferase [Candidatus Eisenbacteria bacterium]